MRDFGVAATGYGETRDLLRNMKHCHHEHTGKVAVV